MVFTVICAAGAEELRRISNEEARTHLTKRVEPVYPKMAEVAHIQGTVNIDITITESGGVTGIKAVSGHPILMQAALDAVRQWEFQPFEESGKAAAVRAAIRIEFSLGPETELMKKYLKEEAECNAPLLRDSFAEAEARCEQALETATKLPQSFAKEKLRAYGNAGIAAYSLKKVDVALKYFKQQLSFAQQAGEPASSPYMIQVHNNLALAYEDMGDLRQADVEYTAAEVAQENNMAEVESNRERLKPEMYKGVKASYEHTLRMIFEDHAKVLRRMGKTSEAETVEQKAAAIKEGK